MLFIVLVAVAVVVSWWALSRWSRSREASALDALEQYPRPAAGQPTVVRRYSGDQAMATRLYEADAARLGRIGYRPTTVQWTPGQYSAAAFLVALILCVLLIGILIFVYMLIVKPPGSLSVTYRLEQVAQPVEGQRAVQPVTSAAPGQGYVPGLADRLAQLASARDAGLISLQEHDTKRAELLAQF